MLNSVASQMRRKGACIRVMILLACAATLPGCRSAATSPGANVPIMADFGAKIVYGTSRRLDVEALREHCDSLNGRFDACGTICEPNAPVCTTVCAYTCEDIPR